MKSALTRDLFSEIFQLLSWKSHNYFTAFYNLPNKFIKEFKPHWFFKFPILQGIAAKLINVPQIKWKSIYLKFQDDVVCKLDYVDPIVPPKGTILIFHGFGGSSSSVYCKYIAKYFGNFYKVIVYNRRAHVGESKSPILPTHYDKDDLDVVLNYVKTLDTPIYGVGFSCGANMLMRYVGESGNNCIFKKVLTCGNAWDFDHATKNIRSEWGNEILCKMSKSVFLNVKGSFKMHSSFRNQESEAFFNGDETKLVEYYKRISAINYIDTVSIPCLCMDTLDDKFYLYHDLKSVVTRNSNLSFIFTSHGGHCCWIQKLWGEKYYISVLKNWI